MCSLLFVQSREKIFFYESHNTRYTRRKGVIIDFSSPKIRREGGNSVNSSFTYFLGKIYVRRSFEIQDKGIERNVAHISSCITTQMNLITSLKIALYFFILPIEPATQCRNMTSIKGLVKENPE